MPKYFMTKPTKYIFTSLFILSAAAVLGAGLLFVGFLTQQHWGKKIAAPAAVAHVDPETLADDAVQLSGSQYTMEKGKDGQVHPVSHPTYIDYQAADGSYQPIDTAIKPTTGEYAHENTTNVFKTYYKASAAEPDFIKFAVAGGRSLSFSFADGAAGTSQVKNNSITYPVVLPGVDAKYTLSSEQMLEELIVGKKIPLTKISQHLKLTGVYYKQQPDGSITFHDLTTKKKVFFIPRPVMYEQKGQANKNYNLHYEIAKEPNGFLLTKVIEAEGQRWLEQATYPIVIDAPIGILPPGNLTIRFATSLTAGGVPIVNAYWTANADALGYLVQYSTNNWASATTVCDIPNSGTAGWVACSGSYTGKGDYAVAGSTIEFRHNDADPNATVYYRVAAYGTASFGIGGVMTDTSFSGASVKAYDIEVDETERGDCGNYGCMYLSGLNASGSRIMQKRRLDNGALVTSFGTNGTQAVDTIGWRPYAANGFDMDSTYIYIGGEDSSSAPFVEKRLRSTGAVSVRVTNAALANPNMAIISDVQVDATYVYSVGEAIKSGSLQWYMEKRRKSDLALCTAANCPGGQDWDPLHVGYITEFLGGTVSNGLRSAIDSTYLYFIGESGNSPVPLRIEKRLLTTGALQTSVNSVTGYQANLLSNLIVSGTNLVLFYTNTSNQWSLERRPIADLSLNGSRSSFGYRAGGLAANGDILFFGGLGASTSSQYNRSLVSNLGGDVWSQTAASIASSTALAIDTDYVYTFGTNSSNQWRIEKRKRSDGSLGNTPCVTGQSGYPACLQYSTASTPAYRYARTTAVSSTPTVASTAWNTIQLTAVPNPPTSTPKTNPSSTELCLGFDHNFWNGVTGSDVRYLNDLYLASLPTTAGNPDMINNEASWCQTYSAWNAYISLGGVALSRTTEGNYLYPNRLYSVGLYARQFNSTDGDGSRLTPPTVSASLYTYPRQVVAPTLTQTATPTELKVVVYTTPVDNVTYTNPDTTNYSVKLSNGMYMVPSTNGAISASEQWGTYAQWGGASGIVNTNVPAGTCYTVTIRSRTDGAPTLYAAASAASAQVCLPIAPPLTPSVACSWSGADYRCTISGFVNPMNPPNLYYHTQYRKCAGASCSGLWSDLVSWTQATTNTHTAITCDASNRLEYQIRASTTSGGANASQFSGIGTDILPPCQPTSPVGTPIDYQTISWAWSPNAFGGTSPAYYRLRDVSLGVYIPATVPPGVSSPYSQAGLKPNSVHTMYVDPFDGINRIGQNSTTSSPPTHTLAILPLSVSITSCSYSALSYQCTVQINDQSANGGYNGNAANCSNPGAPCTYYRIQNCLPAVLDCGLEASWTTVAPISFGKTDVGNGYFLRSWAGGVNQTFTFNDLDQASFMTCNASNTQQMYRVQVKNHDGIATSGATTSAVATLPPCQVSFPTPNHDSQTSSQLRWLWNAPSGGAPVFSTNGYEVKTTLAGNCTAPNAVTFTPAECYLADTIRYYLEGGLTVNKSYFVSIRARDASNRWGKPATATAYTAANQPTLTATCTNSSAGCSTGSDSCSLTVGQNGNDLAGSPVSYYLSVNGVQTSLPAACQGWQTYSTLSTNNCFAFNSLTCGTTYTFAIKARNGDGDETATSSDTKTTAACGPAAPTHSTQTVNSITWQWSTVPGATAYKLYNAADNSLIVNNGASTTYTWGGRAVNTSYRVCVRATVSGVDSAPSAISSQIYTSIEPVSVATQALGGISGVSETSMTANASPTVSNLTLGNSGIQFFLAGNPISWVRVYSYSRNDLVPNTKYCFQAQSRNGNGDPGLPDTNDPSPVGGQCYYTYAAKPVAPRLVRQMSDTIINVIVKPNETPTPNPQVPPTDTEYALCVTKYDTAGNPIWSHYANPATGLIDHNCSLPQYDTQTDCTTNGGAWADDKNKPGGTVDYCNLTSTGGAGDGLKYWANRDNWGGNNGKSIDLVTAGKYDFTFKARSGPSAENSAGADQCAKLPGVVKANGRCRETGFGSPATLFLVKNNLVGWAWSNKVGWISLNCLNRYGQSEFSCKQAGDWGVNTWFEPSRDINPVEGYAWSSSGQALKEVIKTSQVNLNAAPVKAMAYDNAGYLWVSKSERTANAQNPLYKINISNGQIVQSYLTIPIDQALWRLVFDGTDLWGVTTSESLSKNLLYRISTVDGSIKETIPLCVSGCNINATLGGMAYDGTDFWIVASTGGFNDVLRVRRSATSGQTKEINCDGTDPGAGTPTRCIVGNGPQQTYFDGRYVWVNNYSAASVSRITPATGQVRTIAIPPDNLYPVGIASDGNYLWVSHKDSGYTVDRYSVMNITTEAWIATNDLSANAASTPGMIAYDGTYMWIAGFKSNKVFQVRASTRQLVATNTFNQNPYMVVVAGGSVWVGNHFGGTNKDITEVYKEYPTQKTGQGWVSFDKNVCSNNSQRGCSVIGNSSAECPSTSGNGNCIESAGVPPNGDPIFGFCYTDATSAGVKYGTCSDNSQPCNDGNLALCADQATAKCIWETCKNPPGNTCSNYGAGAEVCRDYTTANFNGTTRQVEGWARILSSKDSGAALGFGDWGWIKLNGTYDDGKGNTGPYGVTGTEVDSQQFFGDPDVNPNDLKLYSVFGWGWNGQTSDYTSKSSWLPAVNVSQTGTLKDYLKTKESSMAIDSNGDPHVAWSDFNVANNSFDIYYVHLKAGKWVTATGAEYNPAWTDAEKVTNRLNISNNVNNPDAVNIDPEADGSVAPSLALSADNTPHIVWQEGGWRDEHGKIVYSHWDAVAGNWTAQTDVDSGPAAQTPTLVIDTSGTLNVAYRHGSYDNGAAYYKKLVGTNWLSAKNTSDPNDFNVSHTNDNAPYLYLVSPHLAMSGIAPNIVPHVVWQQNVSGIATLNNGTHIFYRYWNGSVWVTASNDPASGFSGANLSIDNDIGSVVGLGIPAPKAEDPKVSAYADGHPGIVWMESDGSGKEVLLFRQWNGTAWVSVSGQGDITNLQINSLFNHADSGWTHSFVMYNNRPSVAWSDYKNSPPENMSISDVMYRQWNGTAWSSASNDSSASINLTNVAPYVNVSLSALNKSYDSIVGLDRFGNPHVLWSETTASAVACVNDAGCSGNASYPTCVANFCSAVDVKYSKWAPGMAQGGLGWVEFMPAGALLGIPWVQTMFSDIHASQNISLAPPPRGTGDYTSTYLIQTGGTISGIPGYYGGTTTGLPTSQLPEQPGFSPLVQKPSIQTLGADLLAKLDVNGLVGITNGNKNRHGTVVVENTTATDISTSVAPVLNNKVYYFHGHSKYTIDSDMFFMKGTSPNTKGNGVIVVDGDLEINKNVYYQKWCTNSHTTTCVQNTDCATVGGGTCDDPTLSNLTELPSAAIIVRGNIYINSLVSKVSAVVAAIDNPATTTLTEGIVSTGRKAPATYTVSVPADDTFVSYQNVLNTYTNYFNDGYYKNHLQFGHPYDTVVMSYGNKVVETINNGNSVIDLSSFTAWSITSLYQGYDRELYIGAYNNADSSISRVFKSTDSGSNWTQTNGPRTEDLWGSNIKSIMKRASNNNLFAAGGIGTQGDAYRSTDDGATWSRLTSIINDGPIYALLDDGTNIFAGSGFFQPYIAKSTNNGASWTYTAINTSYSQSTVTALFRGSNGNLFAGTAAKNLATGMVFTSTNAGATWAPVAGALGSNISVNSFLETVRGSTHYLFAGTKKNSSDVSASLFRSTDWGATWSAPIKITSDSCVTGILSLIETSDQTLFAGTQTASSACQALYKSTDNGLTWQAVTSVPSNVTTVPYLIQSTSMSFARSFLRFKLPDIPAGSEIKNAYLKLQSDGVGTGDFNARIYLMNTGDANGAGVDFTAGGPLYNFSTSNSVNLPISDATWTTADNAINTSPNLKSLVQRFVSRDDYVKNSSYIGLMIHEGDVTTVGQYRSFYSQESGKAPQLVIEYAPRRVTFSVPDDSNDVTASIVGVIQTTPGYNIAGYFDDSATIDRTFLRFPGISLPTNAEILGAKLQAKNNNPSTTYCGNKKFELRQGLVTGYPANLGTPSGLTLDSTVAEVSQTLINGQLTPSPCNLPVSPGAGQRVTYTDITRLVQTFIARTDYVPSSAANSAMVIRLRGGSDNTESTLGTLQWRGIDSASFTPATLNIDYQIPLSVSGLFVAGTGYNFDRKYTKNLAPAEQILYDGRVVANTPPGLSDFITALPIYHRVTP